MGMVREWFTKSRILYLLAFGLLWLLWQLFTDELAETIREHISGGGVIMFIIEHPYIIMPVALLIICLFLLYRYNKNDRKKPLQSSGIAEHAIYLKDMALKAAELAEGIDDEVDKASMNLNSQILTHDYVKLMRQEMAGKKVTPPKKSLTVADMVFGVYAHKCTKCGWGTKVNRLDTIATCSKCGNVDNVGNTTTQQNYAITWVDEDAEWLLHIPSGVVWDWDNEDEGIALQLMGHISVTTIGTILIESVSLVIGEEEFISNWKSERFYTSEKREVHFEIPLSIQRGKRTAKIKAIVDGNTYDGKPFTIEVPQGKQGLYK